MKKLILIDIIFNVSTWKHDAVLMQPRQGISKIITCTNSAADVDIRDFFLTLTFENE